MTCLIYGSQIYYNKNDLFESKKLIEEAIELAKLV